MADRVVLFAGGSSGYGDAINVGRDAYPWTWGMDCRMLGRATLAVVPSTQSTSLLNAGPINDVIDWTDSAAPSRPFILIASGYPGLQSFVHIIRDSTFSADQGNQTPSDGPFTSAVLYRHDGSDADTAMVYLCNGGSNDAIVQMTSALAFSNTGHDAKADVLRVVAGDLWRAKGYKVSSLIRDSDPGLDASWNAEISVGVPAWNANGILEMGGSPLVIKPEGVFRYNPSPSVSRFENLTPFVPPHPDNGKAAFGDGRGRFYYDTVDGDILVLTFGAQSQQRPVRTNWIDRDTPWGRIGAMGADTEHVYAAVVPGQVRTQQLGLTVFEDVAGVFTDKTTATTDQQTATGFLLTPLDEIGPDFLYFGADEPFWGIFCDIVAVKQVANVTITAEYSKSGDTWESVVIKDSTSGFTQSGCIAILPTSDIFQDSSNTWAKSTVNSSSKYWIRIKPSGSLSKALISEAYVCPYRPPIDKDLFANTGQMLAGVLPKILVGSWRGESIQWHDVWTLPASEVKKLMVSRVRGANSTGPRTLWAFCTDAVYYMPIGADAHPVRAPWPLTHGASEPHVQAFSGNHMGLPVNVKSVKKLVIHGEYLQKDDKLFVYHRWDNDERWYPNGSYSPFPVVVENLEGHGRVLHVVVQIQDATRDAVAPYIAFAEIPKDAWVDEGPVFQALGTDIASPQAV